MRFALVGDGKFSKLNGWRRLGRLRKLG